MRYSHERVFSVRGAVNALPESCSAYSPWGHFCGEFCPTGRAFGKRASSELKCDPNPDRYCGERERETFTFQPKLGLNDRVRCIERENPKLEFVKDVYDTAF